MLVGENLSVAAVRKSLAERIKNDIDDYCVRAYYDPHRTHLGASIIGHECAAHNWFNFRWATPQVKDPRMLRLFNRGHREEPRFIEWLEGAGFKVFSTDPNTGKQITIAHVDGHFGGSADGVNLMPVSYKIEMPFLCEFKTSGTGRGFNDVRDKGVQYAKPQHFRQMCMYGAFLQIQYALYMMINKNDDDLIVEVVELDWNVAADDVRKAEHIVYAKQRPPRIAENESYHTCKWCDFVGVCFRKQPVAVNCRSCRHAEPVPDKKWVCHKHGVILEPDFIPKGCKDHYPIV